MTQHSNINGELAMDASDPVLTEYQARCAAEAQLWAQFRKAVEEERDAYVRVVQARQRVDDLSDRFWQMSSEVSVAYAALVMNNDTDEVRLAYQECSTAWSQVSRELDEARATRQSTDEVWNDLRKRRDECESALSEASRDREEAYRVYVEDRTAVGSAL